MKILAFTGKAGSGKSSVCQSIMEDPNYSKHFAIKLIPFAKKLKEFAFNLGWDGNKDEKGRRLLQLLGTEVGRECIDQDIWVNFWVKAVQMEQFKVIQESLKDYLILVDDLRFENEAEKIKSLGGIIFQLNNRSYYKEGDKKDNHASEKGFSEFYIDHKIDSSKRLEIVISDVKKIVDDYIF